ncbi:hypothetical protein BS50DRAFT_570747 [Corynespora cassiicola Philippines]|uniref:Uncharacterized protein n=1 Tax=Corynespora cassiicola Philippines TaxID=1448308 RepID=A0A2T2P120_CORCC|nr:hypothetical protein BS50DRAFT_570747 [Corynespora cassiicola Philippines]
MSDTNNGAAEPVRDPAEVVATDNAANNKNEAGADSQEKPKAAHKHEDRRGDRRDGRSNYNRGSRDSRSSHHKKPRNDEFDNLEETDDPVEIRKQVEFYFSASNLFTDKHLFFELQGPKNKPVSLKHLHTFKRMKRFQPYSAVVAAVRESSELVLDESGGAGNEAVSRKEPLVVPGRFTDEKSEPSLEELYDRCFKSSRNNLDKSAYVKDFGEKEPGQIELETFFQAYGSVMVRKRREQNGEWKGSVFVEFDTEDSMKQFVELDPKPKFNGNELHVESKKAYSTRKCEEKGITPSWERDQRESRGGFGGRGRGRGGGRGRGRGRGGSDRRDNRDRRDHRDRRDQKRDDSPSANDNWNDRRDRGDEPRKYKKEAVPMEKDEYGVPVVKDSRTEEEKSNKRKATDDTPRDSDAKKSKIDLKEDE